MSASKLCVRFAESAEERKRVADEFVAPLYLKAYETAPPLADAYVVIELEHVIQACLGIEWPDRYGRLGIEEAYTIESNAHSWPLSGENKVQFGRWASIMPQAGMIAVYASANYALSLGKAFALVEHNALVHRHARLLGVPFYDLPHFPVDLTKIREEHRSFYAKRDMKPYLMDLKETERVLGPKALPLMAP
jgi:hypothetical protein